MPDRMPNRMSEDMSDRMPEDLPVRKCINVMVGITRSKVILPSLLNMFSCEPFYSRFNQRLLTHQLQSTYMGIQRDSKHASSTMRL